MYITRKIELWVKEDDKNLRNEIWRTIRDYEHMVFKSANLIVTNQLFNQTFTDRIVLTDEELSVKREKIERDIDKLNEKLKDEKDLILTPILTIYLIMINVIKNFKLLTVLEVDLVNRFQLLAILTV